MLISLRFVILENGYVKCPRCPGSLIYFTEVEIGSRDAVLDLNFMSILIDPLLLLKDALQEVYSMQWIVLFYVL